MGGVLDIVDKVHKLFTLTFLLGFSAFGITLDLPPVRQATDYTCGAAAMVSALGYYGADYNESELARRMQTNSVDGTAISEMVKLAKAEGLRATSRSGVTIDELKAHLNQRQIAIIAAQAWAADRANTDYRTTWSEGHYMVVAGIDAKTIYFMDPATLGGRASLPLREFVEDRWHDVSDGKQLSHPAIFLEGKPKPSGLWPKVD